MSSDKRFEIVEAMTQMNIKKITRNQLEMQKQKSGASHKNN